jgi:5-methyltetrahydrofolate--homocysteine methyltransferase
MVPKLDNASEEFMNRFSQALTRPGILIADGATGTMLLKAGLEPGSAPERWNLEKPQKVRDLHFSYIQAGANLILTNTFGGSKVRLEMDGLGDKVYEINLAAASLARESAETALVVGDVGPTGSLLEPFGELGYVDAVQSFKEQIAGLYEGGVDALLIETMSDINEARAAMEAARSICSLPLLVSFSFDTHGRTMMGLKPSTAAQELLKEDVAVIGANCGLTLSDTLKAVQEMKSVAPQALIIAKPNAGLPHDKGGENGELVYDVTPQVMADYAKLFADAGVKIFGGCCGSTPEHIRAVSNILKSV